MTNFIIRLFGRLGRPRSYTACVASLRTTARRFYDLSQHRRNKEEQYGKEAQRLDDMAIIASGEAKRASITANKIKELLS